MGDDPSFADRLASKVVAVCVQSIIAVKMNVAIDTLNCHMWGCKGWVRGDVPVQKSSELHRRHKELRRAVPEAFTDFFHRWNFVRRTWVLFWASHPVAMLSQLAIEITATNRALIFVSCQLGVLTVSATFFVASEAEQCVAQSIVWLLSKFIVIGVFAGVFAEVPIYILGLFVMRKSVSASGWSPAQRKRQLRMWKCQNVFFLVCLLCYCSANILLLTTFLANLGSIDQSKWVLYNLALVAQMLIIGPLMLAIVRATAATLVVALRPEIRSSLGEETPRSSTALSRRASRSMTQSTSRSKSLSRTASMKSAISRSTSMTSRSLRRAKSVVDLLGIHDVDWQKQASNSKVVELAHRGISVGHVLDFWEKLGTPEVMPSFDPALSTTHDVVRHAIIPLSTRFTSTNEKEGVSYATQIEGWPRLATRMVTHAWGNLFSHLIASIIATVLGERTYGTVLKQLTSGDLHGLRASIQALGKLEEVWWCCAFSVNQHAGICHTPPETDSRGMPLMACDCCTQKHFDDENCEMDKFDQMMEYLHAVVPDRTGEHFRHIVSCDVQFSVFSRLWCVAEVVLSFKQDISISLQVHSESALETRAEHLKSFDVRLSHASRDEDKMMILGKIPCADSFNQSLKDLLLGNYHGLLTCWPHGNGKGMHMEAVHQSMILLAVA